MSEKVKNYFDSLYNETSEDKIIDLYSKWANTYEKDVVLNEEGYRGFVIIAKIIDLFSENTLVSVLDIAAGTGLVAEELRKRGYFNVDAMDPCEEMLNIAKEKQLYRNYFVQFASEDPDPLHGKYDHVSIAGGFSHKHMNYKDIKKLIKYAKPNGYISLAFRHEAISSYQSEVPMEIERLQKDGIIEIIMKGEVPKYYATISGFVAIMKRIK